MKIIEPRASTILYNFLKANSLDGEFIIPINACPIVPITFLKAKKAFTLVDIDKKNYCLDLNLTEDIIKRNKVAGILFIYTYGIENDTITNELLEFKKKYPSLVIIADKSLNFPKLNNDTFDLTLYSTGYGKSVDIGYGGIGHLSNEYKYFKPSIHYAEEEVKRLESYYKYCISNNIKFDYSYADSNWLNNDSLKYDRVEFFNIIEEETALAQLQKSNINKIYSENLPKSIMLSNNTNINFDNWRFNIVVNQKTLLLENIFKNGLFASSHYAPLKMFSNVEVPSESVSSELHKSVVNLFNYKYIDKEKAYRTVELIRKHLKKHS